MLSKQMLALKDASFDEILDFLSKAVEAGKNIKTVIGPQVQLDPDEPELQDGSTHNVAYEARQLKMLFLQFKA